VPCERCTRNQRVCKPQSRDHLEGSEGPQVVFKELTRLSENYSLNGKKQKTSHVSGTSDELANDLVARGYPIMEPIISSQKVEEPQQACGVDNGKVLLSCMSSVGSHGEDLGMIISFFYLS
jgi:hypothetical protein